MTAIAATATMTGSAGQLARRQEAPAKPQTDNSLDEMVEAAKFAEAHHMELVVEKLRPGSGVPLYWRFVRMV